jgi:hypothetical protein
MSAKPPAGARGRWGAQDPQADDLLQAVLLIETVQAMAPLTISVVPQCSGGAVSAEDAMAARVKWARRVGYIVLTRDVPVEFAPYNAIIRVLGTEDRRADYLARLLPAAL